MKMGRGHVAPPDSDQLELELDDARVRIPWGGRPPRELTRVWKTFSVDALPTGGSIMTDPFQYTMFLKGTPYGS